MTIHHATQKKADAADVLLRQITPNMVEAMFTLGKKVYTYQMPEAPEVLRVALRAKNTMHEYPWIEIEQNGNEWDASVPAAGASFGGDMDTAIADALEAHPEAPKGAKKMIRPERAKAIKGGKSRNAWLSDGIDGYVNKDLHVLEKIAKHNGVANRWTALNVGQQAMQMRIQLGILGSKQGSIEVPASITKGKAVAVKYKATEPVATEKADPDT